MSVSSRILGIKEDTTTGDIVPVVIGRGSKQTRRLPKKSKKAKKGDDIAKERSRVRNSVASQMMGMSEAKGDSESEEEKSSLFPKDAELTQNEYSAGEDKTNDDESHGSKPDNPYAGGLLEPAMSLVAPDSTPDALKPLAAIDVPGHSSQEVDREEPPEEPSAQPTRTGVFTAMDAVLGRGGNQSGATAPTANVESFTSNINATAATMQATSSMDAPVGSGSSIVESAMTPGGGMPEHVQGDGSSIFSAFRNLTG